MGMPDREKVIFAIENCLSTDSVTECRKTECPFISCRETCLEWLLRSALALLREQEARVMTLEEIRSGAVEVVWIEDKNRRIFGSDIIPGLWFRFSNVGEDEAVDIHIRDGFVGARLEVYGKMWRAWTSRPSPEQMRDTPWEGDGDEK
jgi:hypothetical protein